MQTAAISDAVPSDVPRIPSLYERLRHDLSFRDVRTGRWFGKVLTAYVADRQARADAEVHSSTDRAADAAAIVRRTCLITAAAGAASAGAFTGASHVTTDTAGVAAPAVLPLAGLAVTGELLFRSLKHLGMACDIGELYGVRFPPGKEHELIGLYALASGAEMHETADDPGRGIVTRLVRTQKSGGLDKLIGAQLVDETLLRNMIPYADVVISSVRNWTLTHDFGHFVRRYVARRLALQAAVEEMKRQSPQSVELLLEAMWFVFIADGRLTDIETALLAHLVGAQTDPRAVTGRFIENTTDFNERLARLDARSQARECFLRALEIAAAVDEETTDEELHGLDRIAKAIGLEVDRNAVREMAKRFES